jgi:hypothetical protein
MSDEISTKTSKIPQGSENCFQESVTKSQISFQKGYLIILLLLVLVSAQKAVWWYRTIIKHNNSDTSPNIHIYTYKSPVDLFTIL